MADIYETLAHWREKLTGTRESTAGTTLDEGVQTLLRWNARRLVAEQMVVLEMVALMHGHRLSIGDLAKYLGNMDLRKTPLGRLGFVSGLQTWVRRAWEGYFPLLRSGSYRPFLQPEVVRAMLALAKMPNLPPNLFDMGVAADMFYRSGTSPFEAVKSLKSLRALSQRHADAMPHMLEALGMARMESAADFANLEEADAIGEAFAPDELPESPGEPDPDPAPGEAPPAEGG